MHETAVFGLPRACPVSVDSCALEGVRLMNDQMLRLYEASRALITYIDTEDVFDKVGNMGCGGIDHHQSEAFYNLIVEARNALREFESNMKIPE
jgi:hypothetical protein